MKTFEALQDRHGGENRRAGSRGLRRHEREDVPGAKTGEGRRSEDGRSDRAIEGAGGAEGRGKLYCRARNEESLPHSLNWISLRWAHAGRDLLLLRVGFCHTFSAIEKDSQ